MPSAKKVDLLPEELRGWLQAELKKAGFGGYEKIAAALNKKLKKEGLALRIGKSALHAFGQEFQEYTQMQRAAQEEIKAFLTESNMKDEADITSALFQQLTTIQWQLSRALSSPKNLPDPREMKDLTTALNNLIRSSTLRDGIIRAEHERQSAALKAGVSKGTLSSEAAEKARQLMGFDT